jgi:uncharacterized membrane protein
MGRNREAGGDADGQRAVVNGDMSTRRPRRGSRFAFSAALTVLMLGTFVSFGGLSYAASQSRNAVHSFTKVAAAQKVVVRNSSAADQYHKKTNPGQKQVFTPPSGPSAGSTGTTPQAGTLPFTGVSLAATALLSGLLLLVGIMLRIRERRSP